MQKLPRPIQSKHEKPTDGVRDKLRKVWYASAWRTEEQVERKKLQQRNHQRERYQTDESFRQKKLSKRRASALANPEKNKERVRRYYESHREQENRRRTEWRKQNRDRDLANQRASYSANKAKRIENINCGKDRRNPARIIRRLTKEFKEGLIGLADFTKQVREQVDGLNGRVSSAAGCGQVDRGSSKAGPISIGHGDQVRERDLTNNSDSGEHSEGSK